MEKKKAIVVGAGLAGMSAAIRLHADGYDVKIIEKNSNVGGKLNRREGKGFTFDTGPSILTITLITSSAPNIGYKRPIILSTGRSVAAI